MIKAATPNVTPSIEIYVINEMNLESLPEKRYLFAIKNLKFNRINLIK